MGGNSWGSLSIVVFFGGHTGNGGAGKNNGCSKPGWVLPRLTCFYCLRLHAHWRHKMP